MTYREQLHNLKVENGTSVFSKNETWIVWVDRDGYYMESMTSPDDDIYDQGLDTPTDRVLWTRN